MFYHPNKNVIVHKSNHINFMHCIFMWMNCQPQFFSLLLLYNRTNVRTFPDDSRRHCQHKNVCKNEVTLWATASWRHLGWRDELKSFSSQGLLINAKRHGKLRHWGSFLCHEGHFSGLKLKLNFVQIKLQLRATVSD